MTQSTVFDAGAFPGKNADLRVFDDIAALYDVAMLPLEVLLLQRLRRSLFRGLHGTVLESRRGHRCQLCPLSGRHLPGWHGRKLGHGARGGNEGPACFRLTQSDVQRLPFADASFDSIVGTLLFSSVPEPLRGLRELRRVLKPEGRLLLLEH
ncbi:methyltransferase domain-containing protein [Candidatus Amarolinea dominans]|uniref:class I SAM-dependent methyltransferase n=1 Tax=Candidatus Amarolinea dominans TaxID=3140696 RepID=UPI003135832D|nr:methyltransferase domain-containing protein [Anaerolineae bacterium]